MLLFSLSVDWTHKIMEPPLYQLCHLALRSKLFNSPAVTFWLKTISHIDVRWNCLHETSISIPLSRLIAGQTSEIKQNIADWFFGFTFGCLYFTYFRGVLDSYPGAFHILLNKTYLVEIFGGTWYEHCTDQSRAWWISTLALIHLTNGLRHASGPVHTHIESITGIPPKTRKFNIFLAMSTQVLALTI